jgi:hypothetical protein
MEPGYSNRCSYTGVRFPAEETYFPRFHSVQIFFGVHSISYAMGNGAIFPGENLPRCEDDHSPLYSAEIKKDGGPVIAQAVSRWLSTAAARVRAQVNSCVFFSGQSCTGTGFLRYFGFPSKFSFHLLLHIHHYLSSGAGTIGQTVADVPGELCLNASQETKKIMELYNSTP